MDNKKVQCEVKLDGILYIKSALIPGHMPVRGAQPETLQAIRTYFQSLGFAQVGNIKIL